MPGNRALLRGFNLLLTGWGSKRRVAEAFTTVALRDGIAIVIRGYEPTLDLIPILQKATHAVQRIGKVALPMMARRANHISFDTLTKKPGTSVGQAVKRLCIASDRSKYTIYVVVHSFDGPAVRQYYNDFAALACATNVRLIATVDHVRAPLLWDSVDIRDFSFVIDSSCHTYEDYRTEVTAQWAGGDTNTTPPFLIGPNTLTYLREMAKAGSDNGGGDGDQEQAQFASPLEGLRTILVSLTDNHRNVARFLAKLQLKEMDMVEGESLSENEGSGLSSTENRRRSNRIHSSKGAKQHLARATRRRRSATVRIEDLFRRCGEAFIDKRKVESLLKELVSHKVVEEQDVAGKKCVRMTADGRAIRAMLKELESGRFGK